MVERIIEILSNERLSLSSEKVLQEEIEAVFKINGISYTREQKLTSKDIPDFMIENSLAVEVKIKGRAKEIYRQCERYCKIETVKSLLLITNKSIGFPKEIKGTPCYVYNIGVGWL